jgi:uncharacterized protein DUF4136
MNRSCASFLNLHSILFRLALMILLTASLLPAKTVVDFDPGLDFGRYKTFAFLGGVEHLVMLPVDREIIDNRVHRAVARELTKKGLREVQPGQNPDLTVRYWVNTPQQVNLAVMGNWGPYDPYVGSYWAWTYDNVTASNAKESTLLVDLIDRQNRSLAWRLFLIRKLTNADKDWNKADEDFAKAFESFPPSEKELDAKRKERADHPGKPE